MTTRCAIYCRVSTTEQTNENQKRDLLQYCKSRKWEVAGVFADDGVSGAKDSRPALDAMMMQARQKKWSVCLVWRFDRFARSTQHLLSALEEFRSLGIDFVSYSEGIDTGSAMGKLIYTFLAGIGEFERSLIQERVKAGIARAQADGVHCGRPRVGIDVNAALELKRQGLSWGKLARRTGVSVSTVRRVVGPLLAGEQLTRG